MGVAGTTHEHTGSWRVDIVSDTHGYLAPELLALLKGADAILHAGDLCSPIDLESLNNIAPSYAVLGNNDWPREFASYFGPHSERLIAAHMELELFGLKWEISHYREHLDLDGYDVSICGHTHRPYTEKTSGGTLIVNPGSPTYPRTTLGPTCARLYVGEEGIIDACIIQLPIKKRSIW